MSEVYPVKESYDIKDLLNIVKILRSENGCSWDREQDHHSIRMDLLEEAYEVMEAIDADNSEMLREELGDLLLQVVFHTQLEIEVESFDFDSVCDGICKKLIYRHPHVFGDIKADTTEQVLKNWDMLKSKSKGEETATERLESVPKLFPSLMRGAKVGKRAGNVGFDFSETGEVIECLKSEIAELEQAIKEGNPSNIEEELGDILFSCCNLSRFLKIDAEKALTMAINKFIMRFRKLEERVLSMNKRFDELSSDELNEIWLEVKKV